ncbi:helix-turn-helix domain-containing protein [Methanotorris igneus]|uniref:Resolvase helix-turn-helix domain protein n=1 Tax=Methanotorris igneus (strain DSM 5666 / JCM 11834 / Kol 5) TaxID=880724 RepID=F6BBY6_METIK|nr:helix-turn-helix domain-containing protein [Methanotorris igneus]AEF96067.1 Resolvase helix-turn-helix domain protein [Methanotorris igneus Kol 5]
MIEIDLNKIVNWKEIERIKNLSKKDFVLVRIPKGVYENKKMKYKIEMLKKEPTIYLEIKTKKRGRKKKVDDPIKQKIINLIKEGYSIREVGKELGISKSTVWEYAKETIKEMKKEELMQLVWKYKEYLIKNELYTPQVQILFSELEMHIKNNDFENTHKKLKEIIKYTNEDD